MNLRGEESCTDVMTNYLDHASVYGRLSAEEERELADRLVALRTACWQAALKDRAALRRAFEAAVRDHADVPEQLWLVSETHVGELVDALDMADSDRITLDRFELDSSVCDAVHTAVERARTCYRRARNTFLSKNLRLVFLVAKRLGRHHLPLADRVQEGNLGLIKAIDRFDPSRGFRFSTYAAWWIRHTVTRALMKHGRTVRIPAHLHGVFNKVRRVRPALERELGRPASAKDLADALEVPADRVQAAIDAMELRAVGLEAPIADDPQRRVSDTMEDERAQMWQDRIDCSFDVPLAQQMLARLDDKAYDILLHRFGLHGNEPKTLRELGDKYGVSRERIRQLQLRALRNLRAAMDGTSDTSFAA